MRHWIRGPDLTPTAARLLLLAPPGAGKGTQGRRLAAHFCAPHIATGDLLREQVAAGTPLGIEARGYMDAGELVPDHLVVSLVGARIGADPPLTSFVLDGYPRSEAQAEAALEWGIDHDRTLHAVINLHVAAHDLVERLLARGRETGRADDDAATIGVRLRVYESTTAPLLDFYRRRNILVEVDGNGEPDLVFDRILEALGELGLRS